MINSPVYDTLIDIFANLDPRSLCRAALGCRRWRDPAQLALFSVVNIHGQVQADRWLALPARGRYRVKSMRIIGVEAPARVLEACGGIRSLSLDTEGTPTSSDLLLLPSLAELRTLNLIYPEDLFISPSDLRRPAFRLLHLDICLDDEIPIEVFNFLLHPHSISTMSSLRIYHLSPVTLSNATSFFASTHFSYIGDYANPNLQDTIISDIAASVTPALEELRLDGTRVARRVVNLARLASSLRRALGSPRLGNLKRLQLLEWDEAEVRGVSSGDELLDECARKGVRVGLKDGFVEGPTEGQQADESILSSRI